MCHYWSDWGGDQLKIVKVRTLRRSFHFGYKQKNREWLSSKINFFFFFTALCACGDEVTKLAIMWRNIDLYLQQEFCNLWLYIFCILYGSLSPLPLIMSLTGVGSTQLIHFV